MKTDRDLNDARRIAWRVELDSALVAAVVTVAGLVVAYLMGW